MLLLVVAASLVLLTARVAYSVCANYCRNTGYTNYGENYDGNNYPNGYIYSPFYPIMSLWSLSSDGGMHVNEVDVTQWYSGNNMACGRPEGRFQEGTSPIPTFHGEIKYKVHYKCMPGS